MTKTIEAIKRGPKPKTQKGSDDQRRHVNIENKPKHKTLKVHKKK